MEDDDFTWHDTKAASNWRDHGVSFEMAREAFKDAFSVDRLDSRHGDTEERFSLTGMAGTRPVVHILHVARG